MISLTRRQQDVLRFIIGFQEAQGRSPSYTEIGKGIGLTGSSPLAQVNRLIACLQERGAIRRRCAAPRAIEVLLPIAIPRAPDGEPLHFVRIGEAAA